MGDVRRKGTAGYLLKVPYKTKIRNLYAKDFTPRFGVFGGAAGASLAETKARYVINPPPDFVSDVSILTNKWCTIVTLYLP